jgi:hypothetical protein
MKRFRVHFEAEEWNIRQGSVVVEAANEQEARNKAMEEVMGGALDGVWISLGPETRRIDDTECEEVE